MADSDSQRAIRLTATPFNDLISPELFVCDLCTAVVTNPQQHFRVHEAVMWTNVGADIFAPFILGQVIQEEPDQADLDEQPKGSEQ